MIFGVEYNGGIWKMSAENGKKKSRKALYFFLGALVVLILGIAAANGSGKDKDKADPVSSQATDSPKASDGAKEASPEASPESTPEASKEPAQPDAATYKDGQYLVGSDIESGLYRVKLTDTLMHMGYVERSKDTDMEMDSIIANIILTGDGYVEIKDTDAAVKLTGVELTKVDKDKLVPDLKSEVEDGIYLVGIDIKPGKYKVEVTDTVMNMGYVERAKNVSMGMEDIIANEVLQGPGYVTVKDTDFAIRVQGAKLTLQ